MNKEIDYNFNDESINKIDQENIKVDDYFRPPTKQDENLKESIVST